MLSRLLWSFYLLILIIPGLLLAQQPAIPANAITTPVNDGDRVVLTGNVPSQAQPVFDLGPADPNLPLQRMVLVLGVRPGMEAARDAFIDQVRIGKAQALTPTEFGQRFGVSDNDLFAITSWLGGHGLTVDEVANGRGWINFSGTVAQVQDAFATYINNFAVNGETHHANVAPPSIPRALSSVVLGVVSMHDFARKPMHSSVQAVPNYSSGSAHYLAPADFATIYDVNPLYSGGIDGTGHTIAIVGRTDINISDVHSYRGSFGLPARDPLFIHNGTDPGDLGGGEETEADLDVQWSGGVAKNATVNFVISKSTFATDGVDLSAEYIVNNNLADVMSTSFGSCEQQMGSSELAFYSNLWAQAAAQGITAFVSSGDSGAAGCDSGGSSSGTVQAVNGLCSPTNDVCVGGTEFLDQSNPSTYWSSSNASNGGSARGYIPEEAWNESGTQSGGSGLWSTGGGASAVYSKPSWQSAPGVPADGVRDVPDVALSAAGHDGYLIYQGGSLYSVGGTSAASPSFAGIMALVVQQMGARQGNANPTLYTLGTNQYANGGSQVFHDVTVGNNSVPGVTGFNAGPGYDQATGLGSVDANALVNDWGSATAPSLTATASPTSLTVAPGSAKTFTVTANANGFSGAISLAASGQPGTVTVSFNPASLSAPGHSTSTATVTESSSTATGTYTLTITASGGGLNATTTVNVTSQKYTTTTALTASPNPSVAGQSVTLKATVSSTGGAIPNGEVVTFSSGSQTLGTATLSSGVASLSVTTLPVGLDTVTASYPGDGTFGASSGSTVEIVNTAVSSTTTTLTALPNPSTFGQSVTLTAMVSSSGGTVPNGEVITFTLGSQTLGTSTLSGGVASLSVSNLPVGADTVNASYPGDAAFTASSGSAVETVNAGAPYPVTDNFSSGSGSLPVKLSNNWASPALTTTAVKQYGGYAAVPNWYFGFAYWSGNPFTGGSEYAQVVALKVGTYNQAGPCVNLSSSGGYCAYASSSGSVVLARFNASGGAAYLNSCGSITVGAGGSDGIKLAINGSLLSVFLNGSSTASCTATDSTYTSGSPGIYTGNGYGNGVQLGSFVADCYPNSCAASPSPTTTTLAVSPNPSTFGQAVTLTATVTSTGGAISNGETITFKFGSQTLGTGALSGGTASLSVSSLPVGSDTVTASYAGDTNFTASSGSAAEVVNTATTTTGLAASPNPSTFGQAVTLTATVSSTGGTIPNGEMITFKFGSQTLGTGALSGGTASLSVSSLPVGSDTVTASYAGDANFAASSGSALQTVNITTTTTGLTASPNPSTFGQAVTLTATVSSTGGAIPNGETITFTSGGQTLGTTALSGGTASLNVSSLPVGSDTVTASYAGDVNFTASSGSAVQTVNMATTTTSLTASPNPSTFGQAVTLTATVTSTGGAIPNGEVITFTSGAQTLGTAALSRGVASLSVSTLPAGSDTVTASYAGDTNFVASSGSAVQTVNMATTTTSLTASPNPSTFGQAVTLTATVTSTGGAIPNGELVTFKFGSQTLGTAALSSGVASLGVSNLSAGSDTVTASYAGDANFAASSGSAIQTVNLAASATALAASPNPSAFGQAVTLTATVTSTGGAIPNGELVTFKFGSQTLGTATLAGGVASISVASLPVGSDTVTASYAGDANFVASSGSTAETVNAVVSSTTTALTASPNPAAVGQSVTLTATVTSSGGTVPNGETITFTFGSQTLGTGTLSGGVASLSVSTLPAGSDTATASYSGDANFTASSGSTVETVTGVFPVTDNFSAGTASSPASLSTNWTSPLLATVAVKQYGGYASTGKWFDGFAYWSGNSFTASNQYAQATLLLIGTYDQAGPCVNLSGAGGYCAYASSSGSVVLARYNASGTPAYLTSCGSITVGTAGSDLVKLSISGARLSVFLNGNSTASCTITDSTYTSGSPGIYVSNGYANGVQLGSFQAD